MHDQLLTWLLGMLGTLLTMGVGALVVMQWRANVELGKHGVDIRGIREDLHELKKLETRVREVEHRVTVLESIGAN
jgi:hypothetical protein